MTLWDGVLLGLVQGLTEFLPISSSGHLALAEAALGVRTPGLVVEVSLHVATLLAVCIAYRQRLVDLTLGAFRRDGGAWRYIGLLVLATIPAGVVGVLLEHVIKEAFSSLVLLGINFLVTGTALWSTRWVRGAAPAQQPTASGAVLIGAAQAVAILPAVSRSGSTVAAGMWLGLDAVRAAEFSFLMSIPAIGGAAVLELPRLGGVSAGVGIAALLGGFLAALVSGIAAIRLLVLLLRRRTFHWFAPYCWALGLVTIGIGVLGP